MSETQQHNWSKGAPFCSCGQDTVTCQGCGHLVCGNVSVWLEKLPGREFGGNVGNCCFARFGLGHSGSDLKDVQFTVERHGDCVWTVLRYHRNGDWVCQEPAHKTTCHFHESEIVAGRLEVA